MSEKITCQVCGAQTHAIVKHLQQSHPELSLDAYKAAYPDAPLLSEMAKDRITAIRAAASVTTDAVPAETVTSEGGMEIIMRPLHEVFDLGSVPAAMTASGRPIMVSAFREGHAFQKYVPKKDKAFVFPIDVLKTLMMAVEMKFPGYTWGHTGTGKTSIWEQICAYTNRPFIRVQHTINMEETHVIGQWVLKGGETQYMPGWLPLAMRYGWMFLADEYDFATPGVLSAYQPVLEGKPLIIKDACEEWRVVEPSEHFRIVGTGNTNGTGDETGLYQGTQIQNSANYDRWGIVHKMEFLDEAIEKQILSSRCGLHAKDAENMVKFAKFIRSEQSISLPISPRALIRAASIGTMKGDFKQGLALAYINRLPAVERETATQLAQRVFA